MDAQKNYQHVADEFLSWLKTQIPLINHMGMLPLTYDGTSLIMSAQLAPNINDKGTGFGGSLATIATLCGWSMVTLYRREQGFDNDVVIHQSEIEYLAPVKGDFSARVSLPDERILLGFNQRMDEKGRARLGLEIDIVDDTGVTAMTLKAAYVAMTK